MDKLETPCNAPQVSVIIPAYNQAHYVSEAVQSVLNQSYRDFELVVVDDGSTDETPQILATLQDPRIKVIRQTNGGLSAARNTGIRESSAPLITLLDSDDFFYPDKLALLKEFLDDYPEIGMVSGETIIVDQNGNKLGQDVKSLTSIHLHDLLTQNPFTPSAVMFRRSWIDRVGLFDERQRACEDWDLWIRMAYAGCEFGWVEQPVVAYRYHPGQMTRESERMRIAMFSMLDKFFAQPDLNVSIQSYKNKAYAAAFVIAAAYAYHSNQFDQGKNHLSNAIHLDTSLCSNQYKRLSDLLMGWSQDPRSTKPAEFLDHIAENLPPGHPGLQQQLRWASADVLIAPLFTSSRDTLRKHRKDLLEAIRKKPVWLFNKGVLRLVAGAWLNIP